MTQDVPRRPVVVDTCVIQAAGPKQNTRSAYCADTINLILTFCHSACFSAALQAELDRHLVDIGRIGKFWYASMQRVSKVPQLTINDEHPEVKTLHHVIQQLVASNDQKAQSDAKLLQKDKHLLELALSTDGCLITVDQKLIDACERRLGTFLANHKLALVNPETHFDATLAWLEGGAHAGKWPPKMA